MLQFRSKYYVSNKLGLPLTNYAQVCIMYVLMSLFQ